MEESVSLNGTAPTPARDPSFLWLFCGKVVLLIATIVTVWMLYAYLHAFRLDWLGWFYSHLLPLTNGLYALVETYFPADVKYKIRGAITDDLGQRSLFLLLLTAVVELSLYSLFKLVKHLLVSRAPLRNEPASPGRGI
jgi:hypothetical protein